MPGHAQHYLSIYFISESIASITNAWHFINSLLLISSFHSFWYEENIVSWRRVCTPNSKIILYADILTRVIIIDSSWLTYISHFLTVLSISFIYWLHLRNESEFNYNYFDIGLIGMRYDFIYATSHLRLQNPASQACKKYPRLSYCSPALLSQISTAPRLYLSKCSQLSASLPPHAYRLAAPSNAP
jgi:hypothetical protein